MTNGSDRRGSTTHQRVYSRNRVARIYERGSSEGGRPAGSRHFITMKLLRLALVLAFSFTSTNLVSQTVASRRGQNTFISPNRLFQFTYPDSLVLCGKERRDDSCLTYIPICDETAAACVAYPTGKYRGYNFEGAAFSVNEAPEANTESKCLESPDSDSHSESIRGVVFKASRRSSAALGHGLTEYVYRSFHRNVCYELGIRIATTSLGAYDAGTVKEFTSEDEQKVYAFFRHVLDSFKFLK
jgi:hypothetical protein